MLFPGHQMKPGIRKLTITRGQSNFSIVFSFVSCEGKSYYRVVSVGQLSFDCRSFCGRSHPMQGCGHDLLSHYILLPWLRIHTPVLGPVHTNPFSNENGAVLLRFQKDLRPHLSFSYRFRPSTLQRRICLKTLLYPQCARSNELDACAFQYIGPRNWREIEATW